MGLSKPVLCVNVEIQLCERVSVFCQHQHNATLDRARLSYWCVDGRCLTKYLSIYLNFIFSVLISSRFQYISSASIPCAKKKLIHKLFKLVCDPSNDQSTLPRLKMKINHSTEMAKRSRCSRDCILFCFNEQRSSSTLVVKKANNLKLVRQLCIKSSSSFVRRFRFGFWISSASDCLTLTMNSEQPSRLWHGRKS